MPAIDEVVCPQDCSSPLPTPEFNACNPEFNLSEIEEIFIGKADFTGFDDVEDVEEWNDFLDGADPYSPGTPELVRVIVIGDKPAKSDLTVTGSQRRIITYDSTHTLNFEIDETNDANYEFMRKLQCGAKYRIWWLTRGGKMYGGNKGVLASVTIADVLDRGDAIERFVGAFTWNNKFDVARTPSPF